MTETFESFQLEYTLRTNAKPGADLQFGMDFTLTQRNGYALCQFIYPAVAVGNNVAGRWNIDNHMQGNTIDSLIFNNAANGVIVDTPTEISRRNRGVLTTTFVVFIVNTKTGQINTNGVRFGYTIDTSATTPATSFIKLKGFNMQQDQRTLIDNRCQFVKYF